MATPSAAKKSLPRKRLAADTLVQGIFDPLYKGGTAVQELGQLEESVFFEAAPPPESKPETLRKKSPSGRMAVWLSAGVFILFATHSTLRFVEVDSRVKQSGLFLESRERQLVTLESKWAEMKKEEAALRGQWQEGEKKREALQRTVEFLQKRVKPREVRVRGRSLQRQSLANLLRGLGRSHRLIGPKTKTNWYRRISTPSGALYDFEVTAREIP